MGIGPLYLPPLSLSAVVLVTGQTGMSMNYSVSMVPKVAVTVILVKMTIAFLFLNSRSTTRLYVVLL